MKLCVNFNSKKEFLYLIFWIFVCNFYNKSKNNDKNFYVSEAISQICLVMFFFYQIFTSKKEIKPIEIVFSSKKRQYLYDKIIIIIIFIIFVMTFDVFKILTDEYTSTEIVCNIDMISVFLIDRFFFKKEIRPHHLISIIITSILSLYNIISNYKLLNFLKY